MYNDHKVVTAGPEGFTVYYIDTGKHFNYAYHQPMLPYLQKLQLFGDSYHGKHYQQFEQDEFNQYQNRLYKDAVYGLSSYSLLQLRKMSISEKLQIKRVNRHAQVVLNRWKQEIVYKHVDNFLVSVFYKSKGLRRMIEGSSDFTNAKEVNSFGFAELNLRKIDIALKLIEEKILPDNFFRIAV